MFKVEHMKIWTSYTSKQKKCSNTLQFTIFLSGDISSVVSYNLACITTKILLVDIFFCSIDLSQLEP